METGLFLCQTPQNAHHALIKARPMGVRRVSHEICCNRRSCHDGQKSAMRPAKDGGPQKLNMVISFKISLNQKGTDNEDQAQTIQPQIRFLTIPQNSWLFLLISVVSGNAFHQGVCLRMALSPKASLSRCCKTGDAVTVVFPMSKSFRFQDVR